MRCLRWIIPVLLLAGLCSCYSPGRRDDGFGLSFEEKGSVTRFADELLVRTANQHLDLEDISVSKSSHVVRVDQPLVKPVVYDKLLSTELLEAKERRSIFISQMLPHILISKFYLEQEKKLLVHLLSEEKIENEYRQERTQFIAGLLAKYEAKNTNELLLKLTCHPTSVILAQAALASDWGRSLSYSLANNPFALPADSQPGTRLTGLNEGDETIYVKNYHYPPAAVLDYLRKINRQNSLAGFRKMRCLNSDPQELVKHLANYSPAQPREYVKKLAALIRENNLVRYDEHVIDPRYIVEPSPAQIADILKLQDSNETESSSKRPAELGEVALKLNKISPADEKDIAVIEGKYVVPHVYTNTVNLARLPVEEKKRKFFAMLLPSILVASYEIEEVREKLEGIAEGMRRGERITLADRNFLKRQLRDWEAKDIDELLQTKLITYPCSIMLAQAALETGWGSSRFFARANNTFGVWSFNPKEPRIRAKETRGGKVIYVKKYHNLYESILDYYKIIAKGPYEEFRRVSAQGGIDPYRMVKYLSNYSELREKYVERLQAVMRQSQLEKYDSYRLDPAFML